MMLLFESFGIPNRLVFIVKPTFKINNDWKSIHKQAIYGA